MADQIWHAEVGSKLRIELSDGAGSVWAGQGQENISFDMATGARHDKMTDYFRGVY